MMIDIFDIFLRFRVPSRPEKQKNIKNKNAIDWLWLFRPRTNHIKTTTTESSVPQRVLLALEEVPKWYDINPFILHGYRTETNSLWGSLASWGYLHNESGNIYSHLIPAVGAIIGHRFLYQYLRTEYTNLAEEDWRVISLQLWTVLVCLSTSTMYHTMTNHSPRVAHQCLLYDYIGIITLMMGNFISGIYFGFYCEPGLRWTYWTLVGGTKQNILVQRVVFDGPA
jgi:adiponectin receptor